MDVAHNHCSDPQIAQALAQIRPPGGYDSWDTEDFKINNIGDMALEGIFQLQLRYLW